MSKSIGEQVQKAQPQQKKVSDMSIEEIKVHAFDLSQRIERDRHVYTALLEELNRREKSSSFVQSPPKSAQN